MDNNLKKELKRQIKAFNECQANIRKQLNEMYDESKKHLEEEKKHLANRRNHIIDYAAVLSR